MEVAMPNAAVASPATLRLSFYAYSRFWLSFAISTFVVTTLLSLTQTPGDPYERATFLSVNWWLEPFAPARAGELDEIQADLNDVTVDSLGRVWAVGNNGTVVWLNGNHWTRVEPQPQVT